MQTYFLLILLFTPIFALNSLCQTSPANPDTAVMDENGFIVKLGDSVENIIFQLDNGTTLSLEDLKGKIVLLQFTASWCGICREEMPLIESELWQKYKDKGLQVIGVDYDEPLAKVQKFKKQLKTSYPLALDPQARIFSKFAARYSGVTRNVVISPDGKVMYLSRSFQLEEFHTMVKLIETELAKSKPKPSNN